MGVQSGWCDGQVTAEPVDVLDQRHVHLQAPLPAGLLGVTSVYAGAPETAQILLKPHKFTNNH